MKKENQQKQEQYKMAPMVSWFAPSVLFKAAIESVVSSLFGNYADRREMESALDIRVGDNNALFANDSVFDYSNQEDLWIDFIADTGDGFNSTYSVASTVGKDALECNGEKLPRGKILILGGDQIYPAPTSEGYDQRFRTPYKAALPYKPGDDENRPHMFAIPGNHDWYDGLGNFLKVFCQQRLIGNWATQQRRSYFVLKLPHNYWLWAIDIQLNEDIDEPQKQFFIKATSQMKQDDKVILVTAKPAWIYKEEIKKDTSYRRLKFFVEQYITDDKADCIGKTFKLVTILTGDLHHYSHYLSHDTSKPPIHFIGAGGGGAALQLTHNLPERLVNVEAENNTVDTYKHQHTTGNFCVNDIRCQKVYPSAEKSKQLVIRNLLFFWNNKATGVMLAVFYCLIYWLIQSRTLAAGESYMAAIADQSFSVWADATIAAFGYTPVAVIFSLLLIFGLWSFGDNKKNGSILPKIYALLCGIVLCLSIFLLMWLFSSLHNYNPPGDGWGWLVIFGAEIFVAGLFVSGIIIGIYLYTANLIFKNHSGDSSASLVIEDYKNFLRMHLGAKGLTIYPIGIDKVTKKWEVIQDGNGLSFKGEAPDYHLIEEPVKI